mgnify:CR=1 FL=1
MKHLTLVLTTLALVACGGINSKQHDAEKETIDVTFRYDKPIGGYEIVMHWQPFEYKGCETGTLVADFCNENGLQFQYVNEDRNVIWYMTNGERALTFKDNRLVDVRLSEHIENFVYFSAPIHVDDLLDKWEVHSIVDEETRKIQEIAALAESLHNESLMLELLDVIENTTILFGNHHEIERILDALEVDLNGLRQLGPKIIVKTCGAQGSEIYSNEDKITIEAIKTEAVDPTGAGDSYRAGFLSRFLNGESLEESAKFASAVSSFIIEQQGCQTNMPSFDDAFERMNEFY